MVHVTVVTHTPELLYVYALNNNRQNWITCRERATHLHATVSWTHAWLLLYMGQ